MINWRTPPHLSIKKIEKIQNRKLRYFIQHKIPFSPYYKEVFKKNKIKFFDIKTVKDLKKLPFTNKKDIAPKKNVDFVKFKKELKHTLC